MAKVTKLTTYGAFRWQDGDWVHMKGKLWEIVKVISQTEVLLKRVYWWHRLWQWLSGNT